VFVPVLDDPLALLWPTEGDCVCAELAGGLAVCAVPEDVVVEAVGGEFGAEDVDEVEF